MPFPAPVFPEKVNEMHVYALYYKKSDGTFDGPAVGLFESEQQAWHYVFNDGSCPHTEFEIVKHKVHRDMDDPSPDGGQ